MKFMAVVSVFFGMWVSLAIQAADSRKFTLEVGLKEGQPIQQEFYGDAFGCTEKGLSPSLKWKNAPEGTKSFAITFFDESAPTGSGFWHYVLYNIPVSVSSIAEGDLVKSEKIPQGSVEGNTDAGKPGYFGPCPPPGRKHTYRFTVYALKTEKLELPKNSTAAFSTFNFWANRVNDDEPPFFRVTAGPRK